MEPVYDDTRSITHHLHESTKTVYENVMEGTLSKVREAFYDEGLDDQILNELRHLYSKFYHLEIVWLAKSSGTPTNEKTRPLTAQKPVTNDVDSNVAGRPQNRAVNRALSRENAKNVVFLFSRGSVPPVHFPKWDILTIISGMPLAGPDGDVLA